MQEPNLLSQDQEPIWMMAPGGFCSSFLPMNEDCVPLTGAPLSATSLLQSMTPSNYFTFPSYSTPFIKFVKGGEAFLLTAAAVGVIGREAPYFMPAWVQHPGTHDYI